MTAPFHLEDARVQMTLAALAYTEDYDPKTKTIPPLSKVGPGIDAALASGRYATGTAWTRVWGPVEDPATDNLVYVARSSSGDYAVCLRGTTTQWLSRIEDIPFGQTPFPTANTDGATCSDGFVTALSAMLAQSDQGLQLMDVLASATGTVLVTGHSQGAALVPMVMAALKLGWTGHPPLSATLRGFAFAPPTSGNPAFAAWVDRSLDCWFVINPLDVVPLGYAACGDVLTKGIPGPLNGGVKEDAEIIGGVGIAVGLADRSGPWAQPGQQAVLAAMPLHSLDFFDQITGQHNHNSYLYILGAPQIAGPGQSPLAPAPVPVPCVTNVPLA
ncbi:MAG: hypothetical protein AAGM84_06850 [Pseudomonadota bacterium]